MLYTSGDALFFAFKIIYKTRAFYLFAKRGCLLGYTHFKQIAEMTYYYYYYFRGEAYSHGIFRIGKT